MCFNEQKNDEDDNLQPEYEAPEILQLETNADLSREEICLEIYNQILNFPQLDSSWSDEEIENEFHSILMVTISPNDVIQYLLERDVLEKLIDFIRDETNPLDKRLTGYIVAYISWMFAFDEPILHDKMFGKEEILMTLLDIVNETDEKILAQFMAFLGVLFYRTAPTIHLLDYVKKVDDFADKIIEYLENVEDPFILEKCFTTILQIIRRTETENYDYDGEVFKMFENTKILKTIGKGFLTMFPTNAEDPNLMDEDATFLFINEYEMVETFVAVNYQFKGASEQELFTCLSRIFMMFCRNDLLNVVSTQKTHIFNEIGELLERLTPALKADIMVPAIKLYLKLQELNNYDSDEDRFLTGVVAQSKAIFEKFMQSLCSIAGSLDENRLEELYLEDSDYFKEFCSSIKVELEKLGWNFPLNY